LSLHFAAFVAQYGNLAVFVLMVLESACIPIPSEAVMPYAGYLAYTHVLSLWTVIILATLANVVGGLIAYYVGQRGGRPFIRRYGRYILLTESHLDKAEKWFQRYGEVAVFVSRLLPAVRTVISLPAGIANMSLPRFIFYTLLGSLPWNAALAYAGFFLGAHWTEVGHFMKPLTYLGALILIVAIVLFWRKRRQS